MSRHIAFFNVPAPGHLMPTLAVVEELVRRGHRVSYPATEEYANVVAATGADVIPHESTIDMHRDFPPGTENWLAKVLLGGAREGIATTPVFDRHFAGNAPDGVVYDGFVRWTGEAYAERFGVPSVRLFPVGCVSQHVTPAAIGDAAHGELRELLEKLAGMHGVDADTAFHQLRGSPDGLKLVFYPSRFGYVDAVEDERFVFVGPCFRRQEMEGEWQPPAGGEPVALVSLGTTFNQQPEFFRMCIDAFAGQPWHAVMTVGPGTTPEEVGPLPPNVEIHEWISYQAVLRHARLTICSGGVGTVMHSLHAGKPLVVVPQISASDGLAAQLRDFGLARVIGRTEVTADRLREAMLDLAADGTAEKNAREMMQHVRESGGAVRAADEILAHLDRA